MVSVLDSQWSSPGWSPGRGTALCSWARHFTLTVPLFTQEYTGGMQGGNPAMDWHPIQEEVEILLVASCYKN